MNKKPRDNIVQREAYGPFLAGKLGKSPENGIRNTMFGSGDRFFRSRREPASGIIDLGINTEGVIYN
jgi:hypothetical protein